MTSQTPFQKSDPLGPTSRHNDTISLMTWNLYEGADLRPIFSATNRSQFLTEVGAAYKRMEATNFPERAEAIADEVKRHKPDLIGLQEAVLIRTQIPADGPATSATIISYDFIQILLDKLEKRGLHYRTAVNQTSSDIEVPGLFATGQMDVRLTDRDAILVNEDSEGFTLSNEQGGQFNAKLQMPTLFGNMTFPRSWVSVDLIFSDGNKARVISTHLDPLSPDIQISQASELISGSSNTGLPIVLMGDLNSNADGSGTQTYANLIAAGFKDGWSINGAGSGLTCCQDGNLRNSKSALTRRQDFVLFNRNFKVQDIQVVGDSTEDRTPSGLWPSDHAGLAVKLKFSPSKNHQDTK